ncbi:hypothetical protein Ocin01_14950 [Orchesella cincta]|uniref:Uncharacterized protein n=1 Tax=Orchesella cincta TaxID=48709 RepID=A0A1D2MFS7_ORCCI|nr:hypothetical protein Ocin01_14950 [Orchesella cincta]
MANDLYKSNIKTDGITAVVFNHRVRYVPRLTSYSEPEVKSMLELVSTRFSTIVTGHKPYTTKTTGNNTFGSRDYTFIPEIVARLNAENAKKSDFQQLTVIFTFFRPDNDTIWDADSSSTDSLLTLDVAMDMSRLANSIYPKTVSTLVFHKFSASEQIWSFVSSFSKLKTTLGSGSGAEVIRNGFRLGTVIDLSVCRRHMALLFIEIKAWVKLFIIDVSESSISAHQYPDSLMRSKIKAASECRTVYKQLFPEADVMVSVNCSEIVRNTTTRMADMALCAHMISEWGEENQVEIFFSQAFDLPHGSAGGNTRADPNGGWWKLARKSELNITKDSFVEKIDEFYGISGRITDFNERFWETRALYAWKDDGNDSSSTGYVVTIVILVLMCVFLTFLSMYFYDRDRFTGVFQRLRNDSSELQLLG